VAADDGDNAGPSLVGVPLSSLPLASEAAARALTPPRRLVAKLLYRLTARRIGWLPAAGVLMHVFGWPTLSASSSSASSTSSASGSAGAADVTIPVAVRELYSQNLSTPALALPIATKAHNAIKAMSLSQMQSFLEGALRILEEGPSVAGTGEAEAEPWHAAILPAALFGAEIRAGRQLLEQLSAAPVRSSSSSLSSSKPSVPAGKRIIATASSSSPSLKRKLLTASIQAEAEASPLAVQRAELIRWLDALLGRHMPSLPATPLHEVASPAYKATALVARLLHPSPRHAVLTALGTPHAYLACPCCPGGKDLPPPKPIHTAAAAAATPALTPSMPDATVAYRLLAQYHRKERVIPVASWFAQFRDAFDPHLQEARRRDELEEEDDDDGNEGEGDDGRGAAGAHLAAAERLVAARFVRAYSELQLIGAVQASRRGADRVERCVTDVAFW
jgi:hypothetical protein